MEVPEIKGEWKNKSWDQHRLGWGGDGEGELSSLGAY